MKVVNIIGGLGNQMFQYAFAIALKSEFRNEEVKINTLYFRGYPLHNGFELDSLFNLSLPKATKKDLLSVAWPIPHYKFWQIGTHVFPRRRGMVYDKDFDNTPFIYSNVKEKNYFDGYWQSPRFFEKHKEEIKKAYTFPPIANPENLNAIEWIKEGRTAFIHVRRGDYINHPLFGGVCTLGYYKKGISLLLEHGFNRFVIFSNDIDWCKQNLEEFIEASPSIYVSWNKGKESYRDMQLMSMCKGALIANSSFSWWGAWLGNMEIVLCPEKWTNKIGHHEDIFSSDWIRIKPIPNVEV